MPYSWIARVTWLAVWTIHMVFHSTSSGSTRLYNLNKEVTN